MRSRGTLVLYGVVVGLFGLILGWWMVFFLRLGPILVERIRDTGVALTPEQAEAVRAAAHASLRMLLFEGGTLILALAAGVILVLRALRRELFLARQQREFLSAVTHELRTPLASARLAVQSLQLGRVKEEKVPRYLDNVERDLERLGELIERVLESARLTSGVPLRLNLQALDLAEFTAHRAPQLAAESARGLSLEIEAPAPVPVDADVSALETILRNLLANAAKYAHDRGRLRIEVRRGADGAHLGVRDWGPGVSGDPRRLFEPFVRGEGAQVASRPGVGLGLFLVSELVRAMGGRVRARNADPSPGLAIEILLPLAAEAR